MNLAAVDVDRIVRETFVARAEHHGVLGSTNDRAARLASEPGQLPLLVVADRQTAGRGRGANRWWTGHGSLAMSLAVDADTIAASESRCPLVALAAAVAIVDTVVPLLRGHAVGIHWPNDVMADAKKLAGILVEVLPNRRHIIGIGLNTNSSLADAPAELQRTAATLLELTGRPHDRTTILAALLGNLESVFGALRAGGQRVAARADQLCLQHGRTLTLQQGRETITGRCMGIASDGALVLQTAEGSRHCHSGVLVS